MTSAHSILPLPIHVHRNPLAGKLCAFRDYIYLFAVYGTWHMGVLQKYMLNE